MTRRRVKIKKHNIGAPPGELYYSGNEIGEKIKITLIQFNEKEYSEQVFYSVNETLKAIHPSLIKWINIDGLHKVEVIDEIGRAYGIHPLTQEDIVHIESRPIF